MVSPFQIFQLNGAFVVKSYTRLPASRPEFLARKLVMRSSLLWVVALTLLALSANSAPVGDQTGGKVPGISARSYVSGSAQVTVAGSFQINADIAINTQASVSDGQMSWLQYGTSGSDAPELTVTVSPDEVGLVVGRGKQTATIGADGCTGSVEVTSNLITGHYICPGVTSYDSGAVSLGKVDIEVKFSAKS
jgi:hypothetical protein